MPTLPPAPLNATCPSCLSGAHRCFSACACNVCRDRRSKRRPKVTQRLVPKRAPKRVPTTTVPRILSETTSAVAQRRHRSGHAAKRNKIAESDMRVAEIMRNEGATWAEVAERFGLERSAFRKAFERRGGDSNS